METLGKILGSPARVKLMRLFLLNPDKNFSLKEIALRSRVPREGVRKEVRLLASAGFLKKKPGSAPLFGLDPNFKYINEFEELLVRADVLSNEFIIDMFKKTGKIKMLLVSGVFIKKPNSRLDLLIVGDNLKKSKVEEGVKRIEAEMGTELVYAMFDTEEFLYRLNMYDKLMRDILDFPHEILVRSKEMSMQTLRKP